VQATRDSAGRTAMIYIPDGRQSTTIDTRRIKGQQLGAWWFDPSNGTARAIGTIRRGAEVRFITPPGTDWVLVIDDASKGYGPPGG
jgi:hypothetical protein